MSDSPEIPLLPFLRVSLFPSMMLSAILMLCEMHYVFLWVSRPAQRLRQCFGKSQGLSDDDNSQMGTLWGIENLSESC